MTAPERVPRSLSAPLLIRGVTLPNRVIGAPMERNYCDLLGRVTPRYVDYLARRAAGGAGLLFTESCYVTQASKARSFQMGLHGDHVVEALGGLARAVHAEGSLVGVELNHAGRVVPSAVSQMRPVAPSPIACAEIGGETPRELTVGEIDEIVAAFAAAAVRATNAGVDAVSVHGAHGYLIAQFLSPRTNRRSDEYGEPTAFLNRVLVAVRAAVGEQVPLFLRVSAFEGLPMGLDQDATVGVLDGARLDLVDVLDVSAGTYGAGEWITPSGEVPEGYLAQTARRYRRFGTAVSVAGRITTSGAAAAVLAAGDADLVVIGRALHADPDWTRHALRGTPPRPCISCNQGCADVIHRGVPLWCAVNPDTGVEYLHRRPLSAGSVGSASRLLVIGGGPAGLEAARTAAEAGAQVRLLEQRNRLGGQYALASGLRSKPQFGRLLTWYEAELDRLGVEVLTGVAAGQPDVDGYAPDAVVVATGGVGYVPPVPGSDNGRVVDIREWLAAGRPGSGRAVTVWGADRVGVAVADDLAGQDYDVLVVGAQQELAPDAGARERLPAVERLIAADNVSLLLGTAVERILDDHMVFDRAGKRSTVRRPGPVLASHGVTPGSAWADCIGGCPDHRVRVVGDAAGGATIDDATASGRRAVQDVLATLSRSAAGR